MNKLLDEEPVATLVGSFAGTLDLLLIAATALGWIDLTGEQTAAVIAAITALAGSTIAALRALVWCRQSAREAGLRER